MSRHLVAAAVALIAIPAMVEAHEAGSGMPLAMVSRAPALATPSAIWDAATPVVVEDIHVVATDDAELFPTFDPGFGALDLWDLWDVAAEVATTDDPDPFVPVPDAVLGLNAHWSSSDASMAWLDFGVMLGLIEDSAPYELSMNLTRRF